MKNFVSILFIIGMSFASVMAEAKLTRDQQKKVRALIVQKRRPTIEQLRSIFGGFQAENPFERDSVVETIVERVEAAPDLIATIELMFPGAIIAPLGRDGALFGDVFDGFYSAYGEKNRFIPIELSTDSFDGLSDANLIGYLKSIGVYIHPRNLDSAKPIVIYDRTSYRHAPGAPADEGSQSYHILKVIYDQFKKDGGDPKKLVKKLMLVSSQGRRFSAKIDKVSAADFFSKRAKEVAANGVFDHPIALPNQITDGPAWHDTYSKPRKVGRTYVPGIPRRTDEFDRTQFLAVLYEIGHVTSSQEFMKKVSAEAKRMGYNFSIAQRPIEKESLKAAVVPDSLLELFNSYQGMDAGVTDERVKALSNWYLKRIRLYDSKLLTETFLNSILDSAADKNISLGEIGYLTHLAVGQSIKAGVSVVPVIKALHEAHPEMTELFYTFSSKFQALNDDSLSKYIEQNNKRVAEGEVLPYSLIKALKLNPRVKNLSSKNVGRFDEDPYVKWLVNYQALYSTNSTLSNVLVDFHHDLLADGQINEMSYVRINSVFVSAPNLSSTALTKIVTLMSKVPKAKEMWLWRPSIIDGLSSQSYQENYRQIMLSLIEKSEDKNPPGLEAILNKHRSTIGKVAKDDEKGFAKISERTSDALIAWNLGFKEHPQYSVVALPLLSAVAELRSGDLIRGRDARSVFEAIVSTGTHDENFIKTLGPLYNSNEFIKDRFDGIRSRLNDAEILEQLGGEEFSKWYRGMARSLKNFKGAAPSCRGSFAKVG